MLNCYCRYLSSIKSKKSFIIVISDLDYNAVPDTLTVVPSILEHMTLLKWKRLKEIWVLNK
jgi:DTW domain-containing protein YfiP